MLTSSANKSKTKWNAEHYKQVKVAVDPAVAAAFKFACESVGVSMAGVLSSFMAQYSSLARAKTPAPVHAASTRPKRRKQLGVLIRQLEQIRDAEEGYLSNIPANLQGSSRYDAAQESVSLMGEAIDILEQVY